MSFLLDDLSASDSVKISFNLDEDILSKGFHLSNFSNRNIINNSNINKNIQIYNPYNQYNRYPSPYQVQSPRNSQVANPLSSKNDQIITNASIKLIDFSHGFQINPKALNFLRTIKEEIIIVSVVDKARTGKSYLMNLLLDLIGKNNGFQVLLLYIVAQRVFGFGEPQRIL